MPDRNQPALDFLLRRRSRPAKTLTGPAPDRDALTEILPAAARTPDHGKLEPWRFIVLEGAAAMRRAMSRRRSASSPTRRSPSWWSRARASRTRSR